MRARRGILVLLAGGAALAAAFVACTFPDVSFGSGQSEAGADGAPIADAAIVEGAARSPDSALIEDAAVCATKPLCDCDEDGYIDVDCGVDAASFGGKKPGDCDDHDGLRHPGVGFVEEKPPAGRDGDWDCSGKVDHFPPQNQTCEGVVGPLCGGGSGFKSAPKCGDQADYYECRADLLSSCKQVPTGTRATQNCK